MGLRSHTDLTVGIWGDSGQIETGFQLLSSTPHSGWETVGANFIKKKASFCILSSSPRSAKSLACEFEGGLDRSGHSAQALSTRRKDPGLALKKQLQACGSKCPYCFGSVHPPPQLTPSPHHPAPANPGGSGQRGCGPWPAEEGDLSPFPAIT